MDGIEEIKAELAAHRATGEFRYPPELRAKVGRWVAAARERGVTYADVEGATGLKWATLSRWSRTSPPAPGFLPVKVVSEAALSVVTPSGYRIEGLSLSDAIAIVRGVG